MATARPLPEGQRSVTPHLVVRGAARAIEYYREAFGAEEIMRVPTPDGLLIHAALRLGDSQIFLVDDMPEPREEGVGSPPQLGGTPVTIHLFVEDADATIARAAAAGAKVTMPPTDMFWGDRYGRILDPFGHSWSIATHLEDLTPEQIAKNAQQAFEAPRP
jgi:PhnB protein